VEPAKISGQDQKLEGLKMLEYQPGSAPKKLFPNRRTIDEHIDVIGAVLLSLVSVLCSLSGTPGRCEKRFGLCESQNKSEKMQFPDTFPDQHSTSIIATVTVILIFTVGTKPNPSHRT